MNLERFFKNKLLMVLSKVLISEPTALQRTFGGLLWDSI
jgi:hypothetical protein